MSLEVWGDEIPQSWDCDAVRITERLLRQSPPITRGLMVNRPAGGMSHAGRLFQAGMWRRYAMDWDLPDWNLRRRWMESVFQTPRSECLRRSKINLYLAKRVRRAAQSLARVRENKPKE